MGLQELLLEGENDQELLTKDEEKQGGGHFYSGLFNKGSMAKGVISLMKTSIGAGILGLPYINTKIGILIGVFFIIMGGIISYYGMLWNVQALAKTGTNDYASLTTKTLGKTAGHILNFIYIAISTFGSMVVYLLVLSSMLP